MIIEKIAPFGLMVFPETANAPLAGVLVSPLRDLARKHHLLVLRGFQTFRGDQGGSDAFADYCAQWGEVSVWPFGRVLELIEQKNPQDHIFDNNYVPLHWDGMYRREVPEFQIFHCVSAPEKKQGGRTTFSNTNIAYQRASPETRAFWHQVIGVYRRKMEYYDSHTVAPIVTAHPVTRTPVLRYNEPPLENDETFVNHPDLSFQGIEENAVGALHQSLRAALYADDTFYAHAWQTGDVVISDNYTLLHGREKFTSGSPRHLRRVHVLGEPPLTNPHLVSHT